CLDYAMRNRIVDGWWGGMSPKQRRKIARVAA
ncbi:MAG: WhiB family transcriptional regulator, partial [Gemmatimonadaceae bacterium]|nr:WhiB family transcriptional regulator [Gemmatimonadaceae bacterium]